jgi:hypothetical protein
MPGFSERRLRAALAAGMLLALPWSGARAQLAATENAGNLRHESMAEFRARLVRLQLEVQACGGQAAACDPKVVGEDESVDAPQKFQMRWQWLRSALDQARTAKPERRMELMVAAAARVDEMLRQSGQPVAADQFAKARSETDRILSGSEFAAAEPPSWVDRQMAKFWLWLGRKADGAGNLGSMMPWLGPLLECLLIAGAGVGLLVFVRRNMQRQRLAVTLNSQAGQLAWARESMDWAAQAEGSANAGDWRDAVHSLYWATIVMLEGRRLWRHNPARTPREYVRLLKPGSAQQRALRGLTQVFERLWYGLREAGPADYERARTFYESLREKSSVAEAGPGAA